MLLKNLTTTFPSPQSNTAVRWSALVGLALIALANLIYYAFDLASDYADMLIPCPGMLGSGGACNFLTVSSAEMAALASRGLTPHTYATAMTVSPIILLLVYWALAGLILWRQAVNWLGLIVALALIVFPVMMVSGDNDWSGSAPVFFVAALVIGFSGGIVMLAFLYLIPNGRFAPHWAYIPMVVTGLLLSVLNFDINGIIELPTEVTYPLQVVLVALVLFGASLQIYRYVRTSNSVERQQTKWIVIGVLSVVFSVIVWILIFGSTLAIPSGMPRLLANVGGWTFINAFSLLILPAAITIAILRYKLWNVDIVINRALVYGGLTLGVILIYVVTVGGLGLLFQTSGNLVISLIATGLVAVAFNPVRERLQRGVNQLMYGRRDDPYAVLSSLSQQYQSTAVPAETLASIVATIAATLKLPYAAIELVNPGGNGPTVSTTGTDAEFPPRYFRHGVVVEQAEQIGRAAVGTPGGETMELPIRYQNELVGRLIVSPRGTGEQLTAQEQQLLADIAAQIGPVASATRLNLALQHSREQLVLAREEERRRIRRDLHDGFGPTLASQTLKLDAVLDLLAEDDAQSAGRQVKELKHQTQQMVADIRRLVYELRPPALDELGLLEALRAHVAQMHEATDRLRISIEAAPEPLPPLPAAIEVAAYRIALEGVTNAMRHARANTCRVRFAISGKEQPSSLILTVTDDGAGLPANVRPGVGLVSMRERAEELGGTCRVKSTPGGGTQVAATLPYATGRER